MTNQEYLQRVLASQALTDAEVSVLRETRDTVQRSIARLAGAPRFYYAGSYAKRTMIRASYDLDIVAYWPSDTSYTLEGIYTAVGRELGKDWQVVNPKKVGWELPFRDGFHVDVVSGRAIDASFYEANLYRSDTRTSLKTSIKTHIDTVRGSGRTDVIRLMKLWKARYAVPIKTFVLELITIDGCASRSYTELEPQLSGAFGYVRDRIETARIEDPANSANVLSDYMSATDKRTVRAAAQAAIDAGTWRDVFET